MAVRIAIVGGGPGGLFTAYLLQQRAACPLSLTLYEASGRLGGKVLTSCFESAPVRYEAGAAELYDYSHQGEDPLRDLIQKLDLTIRPMNGVSTVLNGHVIDHADDLGRHFGEAARKALLEFDARAHRWMSPSQYYEADWSESNADPRSQATFAEELELVADPAARDYLRTLVHSDLATEPHRTSAAYGLQNYLMNDPEYLRLYTIEGGIEQLPQKLAQRIDARILLETRVTAVEARANQTFSVTAAHRGQSSTESYDFVVAALPNHFLPAIGWRGDPLAEAMRRHHVQYDHPAHYLRVSLLFRSSFWHDLFDDSYFMLDAFGGCCLYDESSRNGNRTHGVLGFLLAGNAALTLSNLSDDELIARVLEALPEQLAHGRELFLEGRVHRWVGEVNAWPGGKVAQPLEARHVPLRGLPRFFTAGDYLFDSTLNGVLDSADYISESIVLELAKLASGAPEHASLALESTPADVSA